MSLSFREYLAKRQSRYAPRSELFLRTLARDDEFAAITTRDELDEYLKRSDIAGNEKIYARQIWSTYLMAKRRHQVQPEGPTRPLK